ncbi:MAG: major capsid protein [Microvirus sp.]|nr:MAG: major capsid protein [Microvirus sp.]
MKRSKHTLSNYKLLTCDMGKLVPVGLQEALPGDTFQLSSSAMIRVSPLAAPVMHPVTVRIHHFFVPHRLVWDKWEDFITGGPDGANADTWPKVTLDVNSGTNKGTCWDYYGVPVSNAGTGADLPVSVVPIWGYNKIWNEYYRDQDLQAERAVDDGSVANIGWGKDYFTTARPWTQKGPEITLPLGTRAPVIGMGTPAAGYNFNLTNVASHEGGGEQRTYATGAQVSSASPAQAMVVAQDDDHPGYPGIYADLSAAGQLSINDFRRGFALQRYQEARARYGSRYTEYLRYLGVTPSDARLQRPEYLGGGSCKINFSEVLQTAGVGVNPSREDFGVGDLYGHGVAGMRHGSVRRFIEEHGYIHSFLSVRPKGIYMNGVHRTFLRETKEDFFQRELQQIGQQEIWKAEIFAGDTTVPTVFGYQDRYAEYRETPSTVAGEYRNLLDYWHMARNLPASTALNEEFVKCVPTKRIHNVQTNDSLWCMVNNHVVARRLVSRNANSIIL